MRKLRLRRTCGRSWRHPAHPLEMVEAAAKAAGVSVDQVAHNILDAVHSHDH